MFFEEICIQGVCPLLLLVVVVIAAVVVEKEEEDYCECIVYFPHVDARGQLL